MKRHNYTTPPPTVLQAVAPWLNSPLGQCRHVPTADLAACASSASVSFHANPFQALKIHANEMDENGRKLPSSSDFRPFSSIFVTLGPLLIVMPRPESILLSSAMVRECEDFSGRGLEVTADICKGQMLFEELWHRVSISAFK